GLPRLPDFSARPRHNSMAVVHAAQPKMSKRESGLIARNQQAVMAKVPGTSSRMRLLSGYSVENGCGAVGTE
ncbi:hypothetical protein, partial [Bradyrhizobium sp. AUGA SZCCT0042]|uniref:hypothetical protein n=1 Tax=Bradyrhizobium sp. AUGA SZCCT0042 TaxID=2807651 RepID=UPI001BAA06F8